MGSACSNSLDVKIFTPNGNLDIAGGDEVSVYKVNENGARTQVGLFTVENPTRPSANTIRLTAYDHVTWLDKDLSGWLAGLTGWPYSIYELADMCAMLVGLT